MMHTRVVRSCRPARPATAAAAVILGTLLVLASGCVSSGKYKALQLERDGLDNRNRALQSDLKNANDKSQALEQEKGALASEKTALEERLAKMQEQEKALGSQLQQNEEESKQIKATYDGLLGSLKKELEAGQIQVQQMRDGLSVNVSQEILFASGSAALDKNGKEVLQRVAEQLKQTNFQIVVTGHTDNKPIGGSLMNRYPTNWELAGARAASVVRLFADSGLTSARLLAASLADTRPVAANDTAEGRAKNRRIEIRLRPVTVDEQTTGVAAAR
ncbi:MAG TPA: OmpA family protein [Candidatus Polarisedimenticolia bacterium]|nr:OmpA family protein [Candidatus Polarisedimenticolia bacterium]